MKKCLLLLVLASATPVYADDNRVAPDRAKFYDFGQMGIDGHTQRPTTLFLEAHTRAKFERLMTLKKSLRDALTASVRDPTLR